MSLLTIMFEHLTSHAQSQAKKTQPSTIVMLKHHLGHQLLNIEPKPLWFLNQFKGLIMHINPLEAPNITHSRCSLLRLYQTLECYGEK